MRALKSYLWQGNASLNLPTGPIRAEVQKRYMGPDKLRLDMKIPAGQVKIATVLHGAEGWAREERSRGKKDRACSARELEAHAEEMLAAVAAFRLPEQEARPQRGQDSLPVLAPGSMQAG